MATEQMFTQLPTVSNADMSDIICAVQGYVSPANAGLSVQETLQQVYDLFQSNLILFNAGDPNGAVAGTTYQFCWDTDNKILYVCTTSGASSTAVWTRANINSGFTTTATAGTTTTLTVLSTYWQFFTGSTTQTLVMPVTSTLAQGISWAIVNQSSGNITIQSSGLNTILTLTPNQQAIVTCILNSGTGSASWYTVVDSADSVLSITGTLNQIITSSPTGNITLSTPQDIAPISSPTFAGLTLTTPLTVPNGGTGQSSFTANGVLYASGTTTLSQFAPVNSAVHVTNASGVPSYSTSMTDGQFIIGATTGTPAANNITAGAGINITNSPNNVAISSTGGGIGWTEVTGTSQAMTPDSGWITNNAALVTLTLPVTSAVGTAISVVGKGVGGWRIAQNSGQNIQIGNLSSAVGGTGNVSSSNRFDSLHLICTTANTTWTAAGAPQSSGLTIT